MAQSKETTVENYIKSLPNDKAFVISKIRKIIAENIPQGVVETMNWGMISYEIPLSIYPLTYNKQPLMYAALAAQKNYYSIYLTTLYMNDKYMNMLLSEYEKMKIKPNIGKSCIRFKNIDKIPLDTIIEILKAVSVKEFLNEYEKSRSLKNK